MIQSNRLEIYAIGKIKKLWIRDGINQYKKRMPELIINELKTFNLKGQELLKISRFNVALELSASKIAWSISDL